MVNNLSVSVLGYQEDGIWVAHALELDIKGIGETIDVAFAQVQELVLAQLRFAQFKNDPALAWYPAQQKYFDEFARLQRKFFESLAAGLETDQRTACMPIPAPHVIAELAETFQAANG